jgi:branched-chain amino acid transport system substrate-binding protein
MKQNKITLGLALVGIVLALLIVGVYMNGFAIQEGEIKIGVIAPLTGGPSLWGQGSLNMIKIATEEINANGGINGKEIRLVVEDGKCNAQQAVSSVNKLINVDGVEFVIGGHCSPETAAIVPIVDDKKVFLIAGVTSSDEAVSGSKYAFRTSPATLEQAKILSETAYNKYEYRKIALITEEAAYAKSFSKDIKKTFDGKIGYELNYVPGEKDFRAGLIQIKNENPDAIWISPQDPNEAVMILQQMKELDMLDIPLFGNTIFVSGNVYQKSGGLLPENAFTITLFADPNTLESKELQAKYKVRYGKDVPYNLYYVSAAYDATYMLKKSLELCGENVECVQKNFDNLVNYVGVAGKFTFKENGDPVFDSWKEMKIVQGKTVLI